MFKNKNIHKHKSEVLVILYSYNIDEQSLNSRYAIGLLFDLLFVFFFFFALGGNQNIVIGEIYDY